MSVELHYSIARVRQGALHFLFGKAGSAALNFAAFVLVARLLTMVDYAYYVAALAAVELGLALASFGLDWVAARYLPEYRVMAPVKELKRFVLWLGGLQSAIYLVFAVCMALGSGAIAAMLGTPEAAPVMFIYAAYMLLEGCSRMLRDQMLGHLLLQGRAQFALVVRNLVWVGGLGWFYFQAGTAVIRDVALIEMLAAAIGLLFAAVALVTALPASASGVQQPGKEWRAPPKHEFWRLARSTYLSYVFSLAYGPQILTLLLTRLAGAEATAAFGFARNLAEQVRRYLPADLLLGLVRPALIARYAATGDFAAFNRSASLLFLISLLVLAPLLVLGIVAGDLVANVLSHGKFPDSGTFLVLLLLVLAPFSHRRIIELIANTVSHPEACARANAYVIGFPLVMALLLFLRQPVWSVLVVSVLAEIAFSFLVVRELRNRKIIYIFPWAAFLRISFGTTIAAGALSFWPITLTGLGGLLMASALALVATAASLWLCQPLNNQALLTIKLLAGMRQPTSRR
jgi:O-antigen/teichoic acid export membrane protein